MPDLRVYLDDREYEYLAAYAHLVAAEELNEFHEPTTSNADFLPPDIDQAIYQALVKAIREEGY